MSIGAGFDRCLTMLLAILVAYGLVMAHSMRRPEGSADKAAFGPMAPPIEGVVFSKAHKTLVILVRTTCSYCTESLPFYSKLLAERNHSRHPVQIVAIGREDASDLRSYFGQHGVHPDHVSTILGTQWATLAYTPTVVLVDRLGEVRRTWVGQLSPDGEIQVRRELGFE